MKWFIKATLLVILALFLLGCGTKNYQVVTKSGKTYTTQGAPDYNVESETYSFTNKEGKQVIINQSDIEVIQETADK